MVPPGRFGQAAGSNVIRVLESEVGAAEVVGAQLVAQARRVAVPADERRVLPGVLVVLRRLVVGVREAEVVRADAVLVVDDLGVRAVEADVGRRVHGERTVVGRRHVLDRAVLHPHHDVFPVVAVPADAGVGDGLVLLEVEAVHVRAPAVVALVARVAVGVVEIRGVMALAAERTRRVETAVDRPVGADRRRRVAAVRVVVEGGQIRLLRCFGVRGQRRGRGGEGGAGEGDDQGGGTAETGEPPRTAGSGLRGRQCVLLSGAAQRLWGERAFMVPTFHVRAKGVGCHSGNGSPNT
jgi:hypothetical protein